MKSGLLRKLILIILALVIIGGLLYRSRASIGLQDFSWATLRDSIRHANHWLLLLALVGIYGAYAIRAQRWVRFCRHLGPTHFGNVFRSTLIGFAAIFLLGRPGEPIRPILIARKDRLSISGQFGIYVLERLFDTASTAVLAGISLVLSPRLLRGGEGDIGWLRGAGIFLLVSLTGAIAFMVYFRFHGAELLDRKLGGWRAQTSGWRKRVASLLAGFSQGIQALRTFGDLAAAVGYSALHWVLVAFIYLAISYSFGGRLSELTLPAIMFVLGCTMVGSIAQVPGIGGGSIAGSLFAFLILGVQKEPATAAAVTLWLITFAGCTLAGIPLLVKEGFSMGELRQLARAEKEAEAGGGHLSDPTDAPKGTSTQ